MSLLVYCDVCYVDLNNAKSYEIHFKSDSHLENLRKQELLKEPLTSTFYCGLCLVDCNSLQSLESHRNGKEHQKKLNIKHQIEQTKLQTPLQMHKSHTIADINQLSSHVNPTTAIHRENSSSVSLANSDPFKLVTAFVLRFLDSYSSKSASNISDLLFVEIKAAGAQSNDATTLCNKFKVKFYAYNQQASDMKLDAESKLDPNNNNNVSKFNSNRHLNQVDSDKSKKLKQSLNTLFLSLI